MLRGQPGANVSCPLSDGQACGRPAMLGEQQSEAVTAFGQIKCEIVVLFVDVDKLLQSGQRLLQRGNGLVHLPGFAQQHSQIGLTRSQTPEVNQVLRIVSRQPLVHGGGSTIGTDRLIGGSAFAVDLADLKERIGQLTAHGDGLVPCVLLDKPLVVRESLLQQIPEHRFESRFVQQGSVTRCFDPGVDGLLCFLQRLGQLAKRLVLTGQAACARVVSWSARTFSCR